MSRTLSQTSRHFEMVRVRDFRDLCQRLSPKLHGFMICHRLCPRLSQWGSFGESRRNGIWAYIDVAEPAGASTKCSFWLWLSIMSAPAPPYRIF